MQNKELKRNAVSLQYEQASNKEVCQLRHCQMVSMLEEEFFF